jgi:hypothetical protein
LKTQFNKSSPSVLDASCCEYGRHNSSQTLTLIIRGLALKQITSANVGALLDKES